MFYKKVRPCHLEFRYIIYSLYILYIRYICARILGAPDMTVINTGIGIVRRTAARCCKITRFPLLHHTPQKICKLSIVFTFCK